jgi:predicted aspartyl protease
MKRTALALLQLLVLAAWPGLGTYAANAAAASTPSAGALYKEGCFDEARTAYERIAAGHPNDYAAITRLGYIALYSNRFDDAKTWLNKSIALNPGAAGPRYALAQVFYRSDDFRRAATTLASIRKADPTMAGNYSSMQLRKLASFAGDTPNAIFGSGDSTRLKFVKLDPLPVVRVRINGKDALFFLDTGAGETVIDSAFARELKIEQFGAIQGRFSGGQEAPIGNGRVRSLGLGGWTMNDVPVQLLDTRRLSSGFGIKQLDGILGTIVFYHFLTTFDYAKGELVLRRKTPANARRFLTEAGKSPSIPFWLTGDHFILSQGKVNALPAMLFFVDTGIAGAGAKLTQAIIDKAGIHLEQKKASQGVGAGGTFRTVPYTIPKLSLGDFSEMNVPGIFDGPLPMATVLGFDVPGMIGHGAFLRHSITFDFSSMHIIIE